MVNIFITIIGPEISLRNRFYYLTDVIKRRYLSLFLLCYFDDIFASENDLDVFPYTNYIPEGLLFVP